MVSNWSPITGVVRDADHDHEKQWYTPDNIEVNDGVLKLITRHEPLFNQSYWIWDPDQGAMVYYCEDFEYTSAEIDSR